MVEFEQNVVETAEPCSIGLSRGVAAKFLPKEMIEHSVFRFYPNAHLKQEFHRRTDKGEDLYFAEMDLNVSRTDYDSLVGAINSMIEILEERQLEQMKDTSVMDIDESIDELGKERVMENILPDLDNVWSVIPIAEKLDEDEMAEILFVLDKPKTKMPEEFGRAIEKQFMGSAIRFRERREKMVVGVDPRGLTVTRLKEVAKAIQDNMVITPREMTVVCETFRRARPGTAGSTTGP